MPYRKSDTGEMDTEGNMPLRKVDDGSDGEATSDAEGNGVRVRFAKDGADDDTEGNMPLRKVDDGSDGEATSDAEGNATRVRIVKDGSDDDAEGNAMKWRG
jgi:hypothetical protein